VFNTFVQHSVLNTKSLFVSAAFIGLLCALVPLSRSSAQSALDAVASRRELLQGELVELERQIEAQRQVLDLKQRERVSLERDLAILDAQIARARLSIRARELAISKLESGIGEKTATLGTLAVKIAREKQSLAQLVRKTNAIDSFSLVEVVLSNKNVSEFFLDIDSFQSIKSALSDSFRLIEGAQTETEREKDSLEEKQAEELELKRLQELEKRRIEERQREQKRLFAATQGEEARYQTILKESQKTAAQIRAELFSLRGTAAIPFGRALELAERAGAKTGVRVAFILGIIAEESNLGENVGTGNWKTDMHPTRDRPIFEEITRELGLNPDMMPVSRKPWYGWGGAMGPAQFIPSTWVLYKDKIANLTGHSPPNPWDPEDAFMAAGLLLDENGASRGGYQNERLAALRYFAGWKNAGKASYAFYGDDVMELTAQYQRQIDVLKGG